jgi:predicted SAM-dependent methyltransferase
MFRSFLKARLTAGVQRALRDLRHELSIQRRHRAAARKARALSRHDSPLRLNLGSGFRPKHAPGWINIDLSSQADLQLDLREPLPFADDSVAEIYSEHFLEHLDYPNLHESTGWEVEALQRPSEALSFLRECRRVLAPGGRLDVVVPDAECILTEYVTRHDAGFPRYPWWGPKWCSTPLHCVNYVFRQGSEHKYAYDEETLSATLRDAGFEDVVRRSFDRTVDAENHELGSLCMHARKPDHARHAGSRSFAAGFSSSAA